MTFVYVCGSPVVNSAYAAQQYTTAIVYNTEPTLILIHGIMNPRGMFMTFFNHMCCHSWLGSQKSFFKGTGLSHTQQKFNRNVSAALPQLTLSTDLSVAMHIWLIKVGNLDSIQVW
ncbi:hypothetical protein TNCV_4545091 [Trichonephila clavipes]|nr:hypothetical protein TNCV_4545091 [Trichonephila clavipes]